jgi:hypothetical protein
MSVGAAAEMSRRTEYALRAWVMAGFHFGDRQEAVRKRLVMSRKVV